MEYPAQLEIDTPDKVANWRPLVHWLMAIPHMIIAYVLAIVAEVVSVIAWFAILFTGKMPEGLANMICLNLRYQTRTYAFVAFLHEAYPPFEFSSTPSDPGGTPVTVNFVPTLDGRNRLTCALRIIWLIPAAIVALVIGVIGFVCLVIGFFAVLFTGTWPAALRDWVLKAMRAWLRLNAYAYLLTDEYPPLNFD